MPRNKPRLHLALYARPLKHSDAPHYSLPICPKGISSRPPQEEQILNYHVKNTFRIVSGAALQPWVYEHTRLASLRADPRLLLCVVLGKLVVPIGEVAAILENVRIYQTDHVDHETAKSFDCVEWVRCAVDALRERGAVTGLVGWEVIKEKAMAFLKRLKEAGRWDVGGGGQHEGERKVPVLELIGGEEKVVVA